MEDNLQRRVESLERKVARGRILLTALVSVLALILLVAQGDPEPQNLVGRSLTLVDEKGAVRFRIQFEREGAPSAPPTLQLVDAQGKTWLSAGLQAGRAQLRVQSVREAAAAQVLVSSAGGRAQIEMGAESNIASLDFNEQLVTRLQMKAVSKGPVGITLADTKGIERFFCQVANGDPAVGLLDEHRSMRAVLGRAEVPDGRVKTRSYGLTFIDKAGTTVWVAPE